jgi:hypothetical protein
MTSTATDTGSAATAEVLAVLRGHKADREAVDIAMAQAQTRLTAPLCRRHHRAKTHSTWDYSVLGRGTYLWTTPNGIRLIRNHHGTSSYPGEP